MIDVIMSLIFVLGIVYAAYLIFVKKTTMVYVEEGSATVITAKLKKTKQKRVLYLLEVELNGKIYDLRASNKERIAINDKVYVYVTDDSAVYKDKLEKRKYSQL